MSTPALSRFQRSMVTKCSSTCGFCGVRTVPGTDYAYLDNGKWFGACALHASSVVEQCKALLIAIQTDAVAFGLTAVDMAEVNAHAPANLAAVLAGTADQHDTVAAALKLTDCVGLVRGHRPVTAVVRANKYAGTCGTCQGAVAMGVGRIEKINNKWVTYCIVCPEKIEAASVTTPAVPAGKYALTVDGVIKYYAVDCPTDGKWAGRTFVSTLASDDKYPIRNRAAREDIIAAIAADAAAAGKLYGTTIGKCYRCNRTLTDAESRARGIGPECVKHV